MKTYLIKDENNKIFGPYSLDKLIELAEQQVLTGEEQFSIYPRGDWQAISQHPDLYTILLENLASGTNGLSLIEREQVLENSIGIKEEAKALDVTVSTKEADGLEEKAEEPQVTRRLNETFEKELWEEKQDAPLEKEEEFKKPRAQFDSEKAEFVRSKSTIGKEAAFHTKEEVHFEIPLEKKVNKKNFLRPLLVLAMGFLAAMLYLSDGGQKKFAVKKLHFKLPRFSIAKKQISYKEQQARLKKYITYYMKGDYENLIRLQNALVSLIEKAPKNSEAYSLLCMTYWDLWPYTAKQSKELSKINILSQKMTQTNPSKIHSARCEAIKLMFGNNYSKASEIVDGLLANITTAPFFYYLKAELLFSSKKYNIAIDYLNQSLTQLKAWNKPLILKGRIYKKLKKYKEAKSIFSRVLKQYREHEEAALYLAELEYYNFQNFSHSSNYLKLVLREKSKLPDPLQARGHYLHAQLYQSRKKFAQALEAAQKAYRLQPRVSVYREYVIRLGGQDSLEDFSDKVDLDLVSNGDFFYRNKNYIAAQAEYKEAFKQNPKNSMAAMKAGESLWHLGQRSEAIKWQQKSIKADKKNLEAKLFLAKYMSENFDFAGARKILNQSVKKHKMDYRVFKTMTFYEYKRNNFQGAIEVSKRVLQLYDSDAEVYLLISKAYQKMNKSIEAYQAASQAIGLEPTNVNAQALYSEALAIYSGLDVGVDYVTNLILTYPAVLEYRLALANMYRQERKFKEAEKVLLQLVDSEVYNRSILMILAQNYLDQQKAKKALKYFLKSAEESPEDVEPLFEAAKIFYFTKKYKNASQIFELVAQRNKNYPLVNYWVGKTALVVGNSEAASKYAQMEIHLNPKLSFGYILAGDASLKIKEYAKALGYYRKGIQIQPQDVEIYVKMAKAHRLIGNLDIANTMITTAKSKESGYAPLYKELGALLEEQGKNLEAIEAYSKYLILMPSAEDAKVIKGIIGRLGG